MLEPTAKPTSTSAPGRHAQTTAHALMGSTFTLALALLDTRVPIVRMKSTIVLAATVAMASALMESQRIVVIASLDTLGQFVIPTLMTVRATCAPTTATVWTV